MLAALLLIIVSSAIIASTFTFVAQGLQWQNAPAWSSVFGVLSFLGLVLALVASYTGRKRD
ncbi:MAG: hypothetical protein ACOY81_02870 [Bacillota bacterium]|uniref:hypothetical protein n=1 Tax=Desulfurispora thermophila TaxID=265470 RepID=UPI00037B981B|nr:hypothetical protein [Desulfurispora thermophila]